MTALRLVSLPLHSAMEMLAGLALMVAPFALGASTAGMVAGVAVGALAVGLALQGLETTADRSAVSVSAHYAADFGLALGMAGAALVLAFEDATASTIFGVAALVQLALTMTTRYSQR